ncbi:hypothetical protein CSUI_011447 [Cystoisospora suis]|uniref:Uncharacterized protein n=1 Tax=Cystoisospora suis TaxID=483139 RepID=A0A2C6KED0_9APIC|nr:hypothetical protein CSUI_011447 [Cystoisospora suis]
MQSPEGNPLQPGIAHGSGGSGQRHARGGGRRAMASLKGSECAIPLENNGVPPPPPPPPVISRKKGEAHLTGGGPASVHGPGCPGFQNDSRAFPVLGMCAIRAGGPGYVVEQSKSDVPCSRGHPLEGAHCSDNPFAQSSDVVSRTYSQTPQLYEVGIRGGGGFEAADSGSPLSRGGASVDRPSGGRGASNPSALECIDPTRYRVECQAQVSSNNAVVSNVDNNRSWGLTKRESRDGGGIGAVSDQREGAWTTAQSPLFGKRERRETKTDTGEEKTKRLAEQDGDLFAMSTVSPVSPSPTASQILKRRGGENSYLAGEFSGGVGTPQMDGRRGGSRTMRSPEAGAKPTLPCTFF